MATQRRVFAIIGDLVSSRKAESRTALHHTLSRVLAETSNEVPHLQPLAPTVGDEFQGVFSDLALAARATLLVRLSMLPDHDVRFGIGFGDLEVVDAHAVPVIQDGSAWWNARAAINELGLKARRSRRTWSTGVPKDSGLPAADLVNAHLTCRDALVDRLNDNGRLLLLGALRGRTQAEMSVELGITQGAVSQQFGRGVSAVRDAQNLLEGVPA
jgi:hypothetical protein